jgi:hypothetical protein
MGFEISMTVTIEKPLVVLGGSRVKVDCLFLLDSQSHARRNSHSNKSIFFFGIVHENHSARANASSNSSTSFSNVVVGGALPYNIR